MRRLRVADPVRCRRCGRTIERGEIAYYDRPTWVHGACLVPDAVDPDFGADPDALPPGVPGWIGATTTAVFRSETVRFLPPLLLGLGVVVLALATFAPVHLALVFAIALPLLAAGLRSGYVGVEVSAGGEVVVRGWTGVRRCDAADVLALTAGRVPALLVNGTAPIPAWALVWGSPDAVAGYLGVEVSGTGASGHTA